LASLVLQHISLLASKFPLLKKVVGPYINFQCLADYHANLFLWKILVNTL
jgi:hypothetical protein